MQILRKLRGYSLYELVMTLGLVAIVMTIGIPSFGGLVADHRLRVETDALFHAFHLARKESIVRRRAVTICPSLDGAQCMDSTDWSAGWIVFVNDSLQSTGRRDTGEALLRYHKVMTQNRIATNRRTFVLRSTTLRATNGTLIVCDRGGHAVSRALIVSYTGRPRVARTNSSGSPYDCPD